MKHLSDQELMRIVQAGDPSPASEIYDRYSTKIYNLAYRFLRNAQLAEDATQDVFVKMLKHASSFNNDARLLTWLFTITANWCRDHMRRWEHDVEDQIRARPVSSVLVSLGVGMILGFILRDRLK